MSTINELRENLGRTWESLTEGWRYLFDRAGGALTKFTPIRREDHDESEQSSLLSYSARWGLMPAEVSDDDKQVVVKLEAPGMETEDFDIHVQDDVLLIRGEKKFQREESKGQYHLLERAYGRFERAIPLPAEVDHSKSVASYRRGLLQINLPKTVDRKRRRIKVGH